MDLSQARLDQEIAYHEIIRRRIDEYNENSEIQNMLRILYLFGITPQELVEENPIQGDNFTEETIGNEEALIAKIPTARKGWKLRSVAVPLNPRYEPWAKIILDISERRRKRSISRYKAMRSIQRYCPEIFDGLFWPMTGFFNKKKEYDYPKLSNITIRSFREIRGYELSLCNRFTQFDVVHYLGLTEPPDYRLYFNKLLDKTDIYFYEDIVESIKLKNMVFQPGRSRDAFWNFKTYLSIRKMVKKGELKFTEEKIIIDTKIDRPPMIQRDSEAHRILKANMRKKMIELGSKKVSYENANLDVLSEDLGIAAECGFSDASKMLDFFGGVFRDLQKNEEFWVATFYDTNNVSTINKFRFT